MHQIAAASDQEVGGLAVILPSLYEAFWSTLILFTAPLLVRCYVLPRIYKTVDERVAKIEEGPGAVEQTKADQVAAALKRKEIIREAHAEAHIVRERVNDRAKAIVAAARYEATSETNRILEASERQTPAEKQVAQISLCPEAGPLASELAEKIIGEHLTDTALTSRVADRFPDELEADSARVEEKR